jgi:hypothetical protein
MNSFSDILQYTTALLNIMFIMNNKINKCQFLIIYYVVCEQYKLYLPIFVSIIIGFIIY